MGVDQLPVSGRTTTIVNHDHPSIWQGLVGRNIAINPKCRLEVSVTITGSAPRRCAMEVHPGRLETAIERFGPKGVTAFDVCFLLGDPTVPFNRPCVPVVAQLQWLRAAEAEAQRTGRPFAADRITLWFSRLPPVTQSHFILDRGEGGFERIDYLSDALPALNTASHPYLVRSTDRALIESVQKMARELRGSSIRMSFSEAVALYKSVLPPLDGSFTNWPRAADWPSPFDSMPPYAGELPTGPDNPDGDDDGWVSLPDGHIAHRQRKA